MERATTGSAGFTWAKRRRSSLAHYGGGGMHALPSLAPPPPAAGSRQNRVGVARSPSFGAPVIPSLALFPPRGPSGSSGRASGTAASANVAGNAAATATAILAWKKGVPRRAASFMVNPTVYEWDGPQDSQTPHKVCPRPRVLVILLLRYGMISS